MSKYMLPRTWKNFLFTKIEELGLAPAEFRWVEHGKPNELGETLLHDPTHAHFSWEYSNGIWCTWLPALDSGARMDLYGSDEDTVRVAVQWLGIVKREHEAPDLWAGLSRDSSFLTAEEPSSDQRFSDTELKLLDDRIDALEVRIVNTAAPTPPQQLHIHVSLEHAKDAARRVSKVDWKSLFAGKILDILVTVGLDPKKAHEIFHFANIYIGPLVSRISGLLGG